MATPDGTARTKLPPIGSDLWVRARNMAQSVKFLQKSGRCWVPRAHAGCNPGSHARSLACTLARSHACTLARTHVPRLDCDRRQSDWLAASCCAVYAGRETWRNVVGEDSTWRLPPHICFWTRKGPHSSVGQSASGSWSERRVLLIKCRLVAASGSQSSMQRVLADARDVREIVLASSSVQTPVGGMEVLFPWTVIFDNNVALRLASKTPRDRMLWTSALQKLSGAALRGDDGDLGNPAESRRLGTDYDGSDMGLAGDSGPLASHAAFVYMDGSHFAGGYTKNDWSGRVYLCADSACTWARSPPASPHVPPAARMTK